MSSSTWRDADTAKAEEIWLEFQKQLDLSECAGQTAGIDPATGQVWIGDSIQDVLSQRDADGIDNLLFFERVGSRAYYRKSNKLKTL